MTRDSFVFYRSFYEAMEGLPDKTKLDVWDAICRYSLYGEERKLDGIPDVAWKLIRPQLDANLKKREKGKTHGHKGKNYGHLGGSHGGKGGRPKKQEKTPPQEVNSTNSDSYEQKTPPNANVNVNANVNANVNVNEENKKSASKYKFEGKVVKLNESDFNEWKGQCPNLTTDEFRQCLKDADDYYRDNPKGWFYKARNWATKENDRMGKRQNSAPRINTEIRDLIDEKNKLVTKLSLIRTRVENIESKSERTQQDKEALDELATERARAEERKEELQNHLSALQR